MLKTTLQRSIIALFALLFSNNINAQCSGVCSPNLYEEFNYPVNSDINNAVGGSGWSGAWVKRLSTSNIFKIRSGSLGFGSLKAFNNKLSDTTTIFAGVARFINVSNSTGAPFAGFISSKSRIGKANTTLYLSVLMKKNSTDNGMFSALYLARLDNPANLGVPDETVGQGTFGIGYFGDSSISGGTKFWSLRIENNTFRSAVPVTIGQAALLVLKIEYLDSTTKYSLYANPATIGSAGEPTTAAVTKTVNKIMEFRSLAINGNHKCGDGDVDEIRIATSYQCATPDASTALNQLPIASFTNNVSSGNAPFTASFNGTASADPDGTIASYNWSFSDGGTATGATPNFTFKNQGVITATLTVTDNCGSTNSISKNIVVNNAKGYISCFSTPQLSKFGNCDSTTGGGEIIISGGTSYSLFNKKTGATTTSTTGTFSNLNSGQYRLSALGDSSCKDTFNLQVPVSYDCAGQAKGTQMKIGANAEGLDYFNQCASFKDYMKASQNFFTDSTNGLGAFDTKVMSQIPVDSNGYPLQIPVTTTIGLQRVRKLISSTSKHLPTGNYALFYDGTGTFSINGGTITSNLPHKMLVTVTGTGNVWLDIITSSISDHARNIRFVRIKDTATYLTQPFDEKFLNVLCPFSCIRTMDWTCTNENINTTWAGRTIPTFHSQSKLATNNKGIAYENICQLANTTGKDIWVNVPHLADDNYVTEMAKLFKANLNPGIKVFLEFSNEVWNGGFGQSSDVANAGPQNIAASRRYALRCANVFTIWKQQFGSDAARIIRVLGTQGTSNSTGQNEMAELQDGFDVLSPALYFNYTNGGSCYASLQSAGTTATAHDVLACAKNDFFSRSNAYLQNNKDALMYGKQVTYYEWGQGMNASGKLETFEDSSFAAQISTEMGQFYTQLLDSMKLWNTAQLNIFSLTSDRLSKFGSWGHLEFIDQDTTTQPAPKYSAILKAMNPAVQGTCFFPGVPITATSASNGVISPSGVVLADVNGNKTFNITPNAGFCIQSVLVDGVNVGAVATFTFTNVTTVHTINVTYIASVTPSVSISTASTTVCNNNSVAFNAVGISGGASPVFNWFKNTTAIGSSTTINLAAGSIANGDIIKCVLTANNACQSSTTANSNNINMAVKQVTTSTTNTSICQSQLPFNFNGLVFTNTGTKTAHLTNSAGCDSAATLNLTVKNNFTITATAGSNGNISPSGVSTICEGNNLTYNFAANTGFFISYVLVDGVSQGNVTSFTFANVAATHTIWVGFTSICVPTQSTTNATICSGGSYLFNNNTFTTAGTYVAHLFNAGGCDSATILNLSVTTTVTPSVTISTISTTVCTGSNTIFNASGVNSGSSPTFQWKKNGVNAGSGTSITFLSGTLNNGDVISATLTANNACQTTAIANSNQIILTVIPSPAIGVSSNVAVFCSIGSTKTVNNTNTQNGGIWSSSNASIATIATVSGASGIVTAIGNGIATLTYTKTGINGCISIASTITIVSAVTMPNAITGTNSICKGATTTLSSTTTGGVWSSLNNAASINSVGVLTGTNAGNAVAKYTIINANGCSAFADYNITINPIPNVPSIAYATGTINPQTAAGGAFCNGRTFTLVGTPSGGIWSASGGLNVVANSGIANTVAIGAASVTYTISAAGCTNSRTIAGTVATCAFRQALGNRELAATNDFVIYPNPANSVVNLQVCKLIGAGSIVVTDLYGKQVKTQTLSMGANTIDASRFAKGMYMVSIITEQGKETKKLVVE